MQEGCYVQAKIERMALVRGQQGIFPRWLSPLPRMTTRESARERANAARLVYKVEVHSVPPTLVRLPHLADMQA